MLSSPATPSTDGSRSTSQCSTSGTAARSGAAAPGTWMRTGLSSVRRSSLLPARSLVGAGLAECELAGTRVMGPLRRALSLAKQRAYKEYMRQMADYFAEVGRQQQGQTK